MGGGKSQCTPPLYETIHVGRTSVMLYLRKVSLPHGTYICDAISEEGKLVSSCVPKRRTVMSLQQDSDD